MLIFTLDDIKITKVKCLGCGREIDLSQDLYYKVNRTSHVLSSKNDGWFYIYHYCSGYYILCPDCSGSDVKIKAQNWDFVEERVDRCWKVYKIKSSPL